MHLLIVLFHIDFNNNTFIFYILERLHKEMTVNQILINKQLTNNY